MKKGDKIKVLNVATRGGIIKGIRTITSIRFDGKVCIRANGWSDFVLSDDEWESIN